jgi:23S rRNA pseudouridine1911/1915/1917 synthase
MRHLAQGLALLYEDRHIMAVDKPAGLLSIASGRERDRTAYWILCEYLRRRGEKRRVAVVHRLDRETSGVMIFAKSEDVKRRLMINWNETVTERRYIALAEGLFTEPEGRIDAPLGEDRGGRVIAAEGGRRAITRWKLLGTGKGYSLLSLELETGRRNQIRAHLSYLGHPVAGDTKYHAETNPLGRLALHAESIALPHPSGGRPLRFEIPAPAEFYKPVKLSNVFLLPQFR